MNQTKFAKWLKIICILIALCGGIFYLDIIPMIGQSILISYPELSNYYWYWLIFIWITAIPCYLALFYFWNICLEIGKDRSFTRKNSILLKRISELSLLDSVILFLGNIILAFMNKNHAGVMIGMLFIILAGIGISLLASTLSHLVLKASEIKEENELTI